MESDRPEEPEQPREAKEYRVEITFAADKRWKLFAQVAICVVMMSATTWLLDHLF